MAIITAVFLLLHWFNSTKSLHILKHEKCSLSLLYTINQLLLGIHIFSMFMAFNYDKSARVVDDHLNASV